MQAFELTILNWIQAHLRCGVLDAVMVPVSRICDHGEVWNLLAAILLAIPKTRKLGACVACGLALDLLFCNLVLKPLIGRVRPFAVNPTISLLIPPPTDASFPSGHTAASFASVAALKTANSRLWKPALALAVVIALSRLYLYAHWPTDILGGAAVGILAGWLGTKLAQSFPRLHAAADQMSGDQLFCQCLSHGSALLLDDVCQIGPGVFHMAQGRLRSPVPIVGGKGLVDGGVLL